METNEKRNEKQESEPTQAKASCCGPENFSGAMPDCCKDIAESDHCGPKMAKCMNRCRWFPVVPVIVGIVLGLLGYYLDAQITRVLWMAGAIAVVLTGFFGLLMMNKLKRICCA